MNLYAQVNMRILVPAFLLATTLACAAEFPKAALDAAQATGKQKAVLAGGCFWCTEAVFEHVEGVEKVVSGYSGGDARTANYRDVSTGETGHAEAVEITFDPSRITFGQILEVFFSVAHDPTQLNRQGPDTGPQYRSAVFYLNDEQKRITEAYIKQINAAKVLKQPIVTQVVAYREFFPAEGYHQDYSAQNPNNPYIVYNSAPKVEKLKKACPRLVKKQK